MSANPSAGTLAAPESSLAAYVTFLTEGDCHWGAVLVVNAEGVPEEFLYVGPVLPTAAQKILYGPTLTNFVRGRVIAEPLIAALRVKPSCVLCREELPSPPVQSGHVVGLLHPGNFSWQGTPSERAEYVVAALSQSDVQEPLTRAEAALKYVVAHETQRTTGSTPSSTPSS